jgi:Phosphotransferase enzyme family
MEGLSRWTDPRWRAGFDGWVDRALRDIGERRHRPSEQVHLRPWSIVLRLETDGGIRFAKAGAANQRHEPALVSFLATLSPLVLAPLATNPGQGWMLMPDGGRRARDLVDQAEVFAVMSEVLPRYAELQQATVTHLDQLRAAEVPDLRSDRLVTALRGLLARRDLLMGDFDEALTDAEWEGLQALLPGLARQAGELGAGPIPATIQHDDLHDANVFLAPPRIFDWGDASLGHPLASMVIVRRALAARFALAPNDRALIHLRDAYLEPWTGYASPSELAAMEDGAFVVAAAYRAVVWGRLFDAVPSEELEPWRPHSAGWLRELLAALRASQTGKGAGPRRRRRS